MFVLLISLVFKFGIGFAFDTDLVFSLAFNYDINKIKSQLILILRSFEGGEEDICGEGKQKIIGPSRSKALEDKILSCAFT